MSNGMSYDLMRAGVYGNSGFYSGTRVVFGEGEVDRIARHLDFARRVLVVTGAESARRFGHLERLEAALAGLESVSVSANISPNPRLTEVEAAAAVGLEAGVDCVIGLGGGSAMDAAKGVAVALGNGGSVTDLFRSGTEAPEETLPVVCVPTTAGTGSETSKGAILSDEERGVKGGLRGEALLPRLALVDPELTYSVPMRVTLETGFDVLTHAIETWTSRRAGPIVELFSRHAIAAVHRWLPCLKSDLNDREARREMSYACLLMGFNLANSSTCLPHRMQYPVGAATDTSHPAGLAALYPAWCENTHAAAAPVFDYVGSVLGTADTAAAAVPKLMAAFLEDLGIRWTLKDLGIEGSQLEELAGAVSGNLEADPGPTQPEDLMRLYERSLDEPF